MSYFIFKFLVYFLTFSEGTKMIFSMTFVFMVTADYLPVCGANRMWALQQGIWIWILARPRANFASMSKLLACWGLDFLICKMAIIRIVLTLHNVV